MTPDYRSQVLALRPDALAHQVNRPRSIDHEGWYISLYEPDGRKRDLPYVYWHQHDAWKDALAIIQDELWQHALELT